MKRMDLFCASPSSTATCSSLNHRSIVRHAHRTVDHHHRNPFLHDRRWKAHLLDVVPCSSGELPFNPNTYFHYENTRRKKKIHSAKQNDLRRKSSADVSDLNGSFGSSRSLLGSRSPDSLTDRLSEPKDVSETAAIDRTSAKPIKQLSSWRNNYGVLKSTFAPPSPALARSTDKSLALKSSCSTHSRNQEVVLYVSIHCKGCEEKLRKHISKMEGVESFNIDLGRKKVTIIGDVTPLSVLASVSKVKRAQLWPSPPPSTSPPPFSPW